MTDERKSKLKNDDISFQDAMAITLDEIDRIAERTIKDIEAGRVSGHMAALAPLQYIRNLVGTLTLPSMEEYARANAVPHVIWDGERGRFGCIALPVLRNEEDTES